MGMFDNYNNLTPPNNQIKFLPHKARFKDIIRRGETTTHYFNIPYEIDDIQDFLISYKQGLGVIIKKTLIECGLDNLLGETIITCELSPNETALFDRKNRDTFTQVALRLTDGSIVYSEKYRLKVVDVLDDTPFGVEE